MQLADYQMFMFVHGVHEKNVNRAALLLFQKSAF
jgi:hypothetical protein